MDKQQMINQFKSSAIRVDNYKQLIKRLLEMTKSEYFFLLAQSNMNQEINQITDLSIQVDSTLTDIENKLRKHII